MKILSLPKHQNLTTSKKYCGKEEKLLNFSSFPQYFKYISNFKSPITCIFVKCGCSNYFFFSILQNWHVEVRISWSISEGPLEFEITRVDYVFGMHAKVPNAICVWPGKNDYHKSSFCSVLFISHIETMEGALVNKGRTDMSWITCLVGFEPGLSWS